MTTDTLITGTLDGALRDLLADEGAAREYLRASFLNSAVDALWRARTDAGLTQTDVARVLGTKQSAIARLEADSGGSMSLHRYIDYCLAVGKLPLDVELVPVEELRAFAREHPAEPRTAEAFRRWQGFLRSAATHGTVQELARPNGLPDWKDRVSDEPEFQWRLPTTPAERKTVDENDVPRSVAFDHLAA